MDKPSAHVVHVFKTYFPNSYGGIEQVIKSICYETSTLGFTHEVLTVSSDPRTDHYENVPVTRLPYQVDLASCPVSWQLFRNYSKLITHADIVHYHFPWPFADLLHTLHRIKKPSIVTYHSDIVRQRFLKKFYQPLMQKFLSNVDQIVVESPNYLETSIDLKPYQKKCEVIPIGIDVTNYPVPEASAINKWQTQLDKNFILFVGVLRYYKGLSVLLDAMANSTIPVVIAGSGPMELELKAQAKKLKLSNVHFLGAVTNADKAALLQLCRAVVMPSNLRSEAFCVTLLEGLAYGKPLISTEIGTGTSFINQDQMTGFVIPPNDPQRLRQAIEILYNDDVIAAKMGNTAHLRYQQHFNGKQMGTSYADVYNNVINSSRAR